MNIYENLDQIAAKGYDAGVAAERERICQLAEHEAARLSDVGLAHAFRQFAALLTEPVSVLTKDDTHGRG